MVEIKIDNQEIIFRIILCGQQKATKFATVRELQEDLRASGAENLTVIHAGGDRIVGFRWPLEEKDNLFGMRVLIDVMARPGQLNTTANDVLIYRSADAIIYLDDREPDGDSVVEHFSAFLAQLEGLARKPDELPLLVQTYADAGEDRRSHFTSRKSAWKPKMHTIGVTAEQSLDVLRSAKSHVLRNYRGYESELSKRGLDGHIKIRDRVYECVPVDPCIVPATDELGQEVRLIPSLSSRSKNAIFTRSVLLCIAALITLAAAIVVSISL